MAQITRDIGTSHAPQLNLTSNEGGQRMGTYCSETTLANIGEDYKFEGSHASRGSGSQL